LKPASEWVIAADPGTPRPPFRFAPEDERLLDEVQRAAFWYLWRCADPVTGMCYDRSSVTFASVAGVGFQLAAIPGAAERGWITRDEGRARALSILKALEAEPTNRKAGLFYHFLDGRTARPIDNDVVSTIDSALLLAGVLVAGQYFCGEVREVGDRLFEGADWSFFVLRTPQRHEPYLKDYVSLGWRPRSFKADPTGEGRLSPYAWADAGDEQRLVALLACAAPREERRVGPENYYRLRRTLGEHASADGGRAAPHCWFPFSGALFTDVFAHCFIDYAHQGPDDPARAGVERRPKVDWWENSRRAVDLHRAKAREAGAAGVPTLGEHAWGLTACDAAKGYSVPGVFPRRIPTEGEVPQVDFPTFVPKDDFNGGTVAPYGAGCAVMFQPGPAVAALRHYRGLKGPDGSPLVWRDPGANGETGEYGFRDSFNLGTGWVAPDYVAIDQGPLVLAIENARTGVVWKLFQAHPAVQGAWGRLGWAQPTPTAKPPSAQPVGLAPGAPAPESGR
jgi:hypothetical protein